MNTQLVTEAKAFKTVSEHDDGDFDRKITELLKDGWKLFGTPTTTVGHSYNWMTQHLIKEF
jgi:hypothetical protein